MEGREHLHGFLTHAGMLSDTVALLALTLSKALKVVHTLTHSDPTVPR